MAPQKLKAFQKPENRNIQSSNSTSGNLPKNTKPLIQEGIYTPMFIAALLIITKIWKQPKCPLTDEWIKMGYIYTMKYYLAIKNKEIFSFETAWMVLAGRYAKNKSGRERQIPYVHLFLIRNSGNLICQENGLLINEV